MHSSKRKSAKWNTKSTKLTPSTPSTGEIQHLFQLQSLELKMADPRAAPPGNHASHSSPALPAASMSSEAYPDIPPAFLSDPRRSSPYPPTTYQEDNELRTLLQALPTKSDMEALIGRVEAAHRQELQIVRKEVQVLSSRLTTGEASLSTLDQRVSALEAT